MTDTKTTTSAYKKFDEMVHAILSDRGFEKGDRHFANGMLKHRDGSRTELHYKFNPTMDKYYRETSKVSVSIAGTYEHDRGGTARSLYSHHDYRATMNSTEENAKKVADRIERYFVAAVEAEARLRTKDAKKLAHTVDLKAMARKLGSRDSVDAVDLFERGRIEPITDGVSAAARVEIGAGGYTVRSNSGRHGSRSPEFLIKATTADIASEDRHSKPNGFSEITIKAPGRVGRIHDSVAEKIFAAVADIIAEERGSGLIVRGGE